MGMILTARHVTAKEGHELGFVNEVVPPGEALIAAERWAETICKNSPMSIRASKQAIQKGLAVSLEQAMAEQREYPAVKAMAASQDYIEGPKAFSEKRPPKWVGGSDPSCPGRGAAFFTMHRRAGTQTATPDGPRISSAPRRKGGALRSIRGTRCCYFPPNSLLYDA